MNNAPDKQRKALGKGLSALLPGRSRRRRSAAAAAAGRSVAIRVAHIADRSDRAESDAAADGLRFGAARRAGRFDPSQRHHSAAHRTPQGRSLPIDRR